MRAGLACLGFALALGWVVDLSLPTKEGSLKFKFDSGAGAPVVLVFVVGALGVALTVAGVAWEIYRQREERRQLARKKVIVVEVRGLRDTSGAPLVDAVSPSLEGRRESLLFNLRQGLSDGQIVEPRIAVAKLAALPADIARRFEGLDRSDITLIYGGLAPVPLTFLCGVLVDDEGAVETMDWDRHRDAWRRLDADDDGGRFDINGLEVVTANASDVLLAVSVSYQVNLPGARAKILDAPLVEMGLATRNPDAHWSDHKQRELGRQFLETLIALEGLGVGHVHLFLAAPNSMVFRLGRLYDKRNLPKLTVYQYQQESEPPFTWGVVMPAGGREHPVVVS